MIWPFVCIALGIGNIIKYRPRKTGAEHYEVIA